MDFCAKIWRNVNVSNKIFLKQLETLAENHLRGSSPTHIQPLSANEELKQECTQLQQQLRTHVVNENKLKDKCQRSVELIKDFLIKQVDNFFSFCY